MKRNTSVICACAVLAFIGSALCDGEGSDIGSQTAAGGASPGTGASDCPENVDTYTDKQVREEILRKIERCLNQSDQDFKAQIDTEQIENARSFFIDFCQKLPKVNECLVEETSKWKKCHSDLRSKVFNIVRDVVENSLERGCADNGDSLATIAHGFNRITKDLRARDDFVRNCLILTSNKFKAVMNAQAHPSSTIWFVYHEMKRFRECFNNNIHDEETFVSVADEHINGTIDSMKCIHPIDETVVLCKTIDSNLIDKTNICPLKRRIDPNVVAISLVLEARSTSCFVVYDSYSPQLKDAKSIEEFRSYFENYCRRKNRVKSCLQETDFAADICLHEPQYKTFQLVTDYLKLALDSMCLEDGRRLANIVYTVKNRKDNSTDQQDPLIQCLTQVKGMVVPGPDNPSRVFEYYQSFPGLRDCLVSIVAGDSTFVDDVESLTNEMITKMKCPHPENGTTVLCITLVGN